MSSADPQGLQSFPSELSQREAWLEPFDWYREMRETTPVRHDPDRDTWDVFRHADVKRVLDDDETFSVEPAKADDYVEPTEFGQDIFSETMLLRDPPRHDDLRSVVDDEFSPRALKSMEPRVRTIARDLLDTAVDDGDGRMDVVEDLSYPLAVIVIAEILGVPDQRHDQFREWSDAIVASTSTAEGADDVFEQQTQSLGEMATYFMELVEKRREDPQDDLISTMVAGEDATLGQQEVLGMCILLLVAGNITTTQFIANAVRCFDERDLFEPLAADEFAMPAVLEEVLRYRSPVQAMARIATQEVTLQDETIEAGERVIAWIGSANRDDRQFENPDEFVPARSPTQHLAFGHGTHYCLGAPLARLEARVALEEMLDRLSEVRVADTTLEPTRSSFIYGVESLPLEYTPAE